MYSIYTNSVWLWGVVGGVKLCCRPYSARVLHSVSDQIQNLQNCFTTPNKMTCKDYIKGLVSLKFLRPCPSHPPPSPLPQRLSQSAGMIISRADYYLMPHISPSLGFTNWKLKKRESFIFHPCLKYIMFDKGATLNFYDHRKTAQKSVEFNQYFTIQLSCVDTLYVW